MNLKSNSSGTLLMPTLPTDRNVVPLNPLTGYFDSGAKARIRISVKFELDSHKNTLLVPNDEFLQGQMASIGYFDEVISFKELEAQVARKMTVPTQLAFSDRANLRAVHQQVKPFLWFRTNHRTDGSKKFVQFLLTDPETMTDVFMAEINLDYFWAGVNDQTTWYPLFNELVSYITANSPLYRTLRTSKAALLHQETAAV